MGIKLKMRGLWGGMVDDGRGPCVTTRAIYRGTIAGIGLIDETAGVQLEALVSVVICRPYDPLEGWPFLEWLF